MNEDTFVESVIVEKLSSDISKEKIEEMWQICGNAGGENSCEKAFKVYECYWKNKT